jgi:biopolymer transport protein ExbD
MDLRPPEPPRRPEPVLPMVNLVFLLLVFFLMVATLAPPPPVAIEPPRAEGVAAGAGPAPRLALDAAGEVHHEAGPARRRSPRSPVRPR